MTELHLLRAILNDPTYEVGQRAKSPIPASFRGKENTSMSFVTRWRKGRFIQWKDFGFESKLGSDIVALYAYTRKNGDRKAAFEDLSGGDISIEYTPPTTDQRIESLKLPLNFRYGDLDYRNLDYLRRLFVSDEIILEYGISALLSVKMGRKSLFSASRTKFGFHWKVGDHGQKGYAPFNGYFKKDKWKKVKFWHDNMDVLEGWDQLPERARECGFTKSSKDIWTLRSLGVEACVSTSGENTLKLLTPALCKELNDRFDDFWFWGDPDPVGIAYSKELKKRLGKGRILESRIDKDPSDIIVATGRQDDVREIVGLA